MKTLLLLALWQTESPPTTVSQYLVSGGIAGLVLLLWRQDRKDRDLERIEREKQHSALATDFRQIVTENTAAITALRDAVVNAPVRACPLVHANRESADSR